MRNNLVLIGLCAVLCHTSCHSKKEEKEEETKFLVTNPLKTDTTITREYVSQIHAIQHIEVRALEKGYLQNIYVDEGQFVKKGQVMFQIMPLIYNAELQKAQAEADFVEIEYQNTKQLSEKNVVSPNELALAKAKLNKAKAELALAQTHLQFTEIRAPFDGMMDHFQVRLGSLIDEGDLLTTLSDNSEMWVYFNVPEAEYLNYKTNVTEENMLKVNLLMANNQVFKYPGVVKTIEADFNNETGDLTSPVRISFDQDTFHVAGVAVSANSRYLYASALKKIYQFDLHASDVEASKLLIGVWDGYADPYPTVFYLSALAPDGKIYIAGTSTHNYLHIIHQPNCQGQNCKFEQRGLKLPGYNFISITNIPHYRSQNITLPCDSIMVSSKGINNSTSVFLYPNPAQEYIIIDAENKLPEATIEIYDLLMRRIIHRKITENIVKIDLKNIENGIYTLLVKSNDAIIAVEKIIIEK